MKSVRPTRPGELPGRERGPLTRRCWAGIVCLMLTLLATTPALASAQSASGDLWRAIEGLQSADPATRAAARARLIEREDPAVAAPLVELIFFSREAREDAVRALEEILDLETPATTPAYRFWLEEIGRRRDVRPLAGYVEFKAALYSRIDPAFGEFLSTAHPMRIRPEEIVFGGVPKDGIPALDRPAVTRADQAGWLRDDAIVFGLYVNGEARAYPRSILDWHEMANDRLGGQAVSLAWCTLCGSAIAYRGDAGTRTLTFGSSGLLYRSNKLMYDRETGSLWSQLAGEPVAGPMAEEPVALERLPIVVTSWKDWRTIHPDSTVLSRETGFARDYDRPPYRDYFASDRLMFPVWNADARLPSKEWIWGTVLDGVPRAWRISELQRRPILNDRVGDRPVVLLTNPVTGGVRLYERTEQGEFLGLRAGALMTADGDAWEITETALVGADDRRLERLAGHEAFWFAWSSQYPSTSLFEPLADRNADPEQ